ncbi:T9SS type A sorting domain-containing protein [Formosa sp. S-31]|uniref:T9SS type A sorting domain-containing protein n=1 Tax=Formosa sp. S-31 TaxID=2790949 RepID=UPI003EBCFFCF
MKKITLMAFCLIGFYSHNMLGQTTAIPDSKFEEALIELGIDSDKTVNGEVLTSDIENVVRLDLLGKGISDLTGIEGFKGLTHLDASQNYLFDINVTENLELEDLSVGSNGLQNLDVSKNEKLTRLECTRNKLTEIDLSNNSKLLTFQGFENEFISLDFSSNSSINWVSCNDNKINNLVFGETDNLENLICPGNEMVSFDISSGFSKLEILYIYNNSKLESLNLKNGNNSNLIVFAQGCVNLTCVQVDNEAAANAGIGSYQMWNLPTQAVYSENCATLSVNDFVVNDSKVFYDKSSSVINISTPLKVKNISLYNLSGQELISYNSNPESILVDNFPDGVYLIQIDSEMGRDIKKVIKY